MPNKASQRDQKTTAGTSPQVVDAYLNLEVGINGKDSQQRTRY